MLHISRQEQLLSIKRLVLLPNNWGRYGAALWELASRLKLEVTDDSADPLPGDFWVGCHPGSGWGEADPSLIAWASSVDVPQAVGLLHQEALQSTSQPGFDDRQ